jgi:hypothetical protein
MAPKSGRTKRKSNNTYAVADNNADIVKHVPKKLITISDHMPLMKKATLTSSAAVIRNKGHDDEEEDATENNVLSDSNVWGESVAEEVVVEHENSNFHSSKEVNAYVCYNSLMRKNKNVSVTKKNQSVRKGDPLEILLLRNLCRFRSQNGPPLHTTSSPHSFLVLQPQIGRYIIQ